MHITFFRKSGDSKEWLILKVIQCTFRIFKTKFSFSLPNVLFSQSLSHILSKNARSLSFYKRVYPSVNKLNNGMRFIKVIKIISVHT